MWEWSDRTCPARGPGLTHTFVGEVGHAVPCRECHLPIRSVAERSPGLPPLDVNARLRQLGLMPPPEDLPFTVTRVDKAEETPVEPKMAQGTYPGPDWGPGRGDLTPRQAATLIARVGWVLWLRSRTPDGT